MDQWLCRFVAAQIEWFSNYEQQQKQKRTINTSVPQSFSYCWRPPFEFQLRKNQFHSQRRHRCHSPFTKQQLQLSRALDGSTRGVRENGRRSVFEQRTLSTFDWTILMHKNWNYFVKIIRRRKSFFCSMKKSLHTNRNGKIGKTVASSLIWLEYT